MAVMLEALDVADGMRVLEVGTGTGYNAALLSHRLGGDLVTSVDIDTDLVHAARLAPHAAGYEPHVAVADGLAGYPPRAPYDRIIATCSVRRVPAAWFQQVVPGGIVVANLSYGVVPLRVEADGTASGTFLRQVAAFIEARPAGGPPGPTTDQIIAACVGREGMEGDAGPAAAVVAEEGFEFVWRLHEPAVYLCTVSPPDEQVHCLLDADSGSWARVHQDAAGARVVQGGSRRIWNAITAVHGWWQGAGCPAHDRLRLAVDTDGRQEVTVTAGHPQG